MVMFVHRSVHDIIVQTLHRRNIRVVNNTELIKVLSLEEKQARGLSMSLHWLESVDGRVFPFDEAFWCTQVITFIHHKYVCISL